MKKYSTYTKKSLSLFLAVLMVLSCWVWVAPANVSAEETTPDGVTKENETVSDCPYEEHKYEETEDGHMVCECGDMKAVNLTFKSNIGTILDEANNSDTLTESVYVGETYTIRVPANVETDAYAYTFIGWFKSDEKVSGSTELEVIAEDADETYIAEYNSVKRKYTISYLDDGGKSIASYTYEYGDIITHKEPEIEKDYEADPYGIHYVFTGWNAVGTAPEDTKVMGSITYTATFITATHVFTPKWVDADCVTVGGYRHVCECGYSYLIDENESIEKTGHTVGVVKSLKEATMFEEGEKVYICAVCEKEVTEVLPVLERTTINIQVYDSEGKEADFVDVELFYTITVKDKEVEVQFTDAFDYLTDANGFIAIEVPKDYKGWRARVYYEGGSYFAPLKTGDEVINVFGEKGEDPEDAPDLSDETKHKENCSCACHKKSLWGFFYRLFQKLVFKFTGRVTCCSIPDERIYA